MNIEFVYCITVFNLIMLYHVEKIKKPKETYISFCTPSLNKQIPSKAYSVILNCMAQYIYTLQYDNLLSVFFTFLSESLPEKYGVKTRLVISMQYFFTNTYIFVKNKLDVITKDTIFCVGKQ